MGLETVDLPEHNAAVHAPRTQHVGTIIILRHRGFQSGVRYIARPTISGRAFGSPAKGRHLCAIQLRLDGRLTDEGLGIGFLLT